MKKITKPAHNRLMGETEMIYVKTTYDIKSMRLPNISKYSSRKKADSFVKICLKWGIGIMSCKIITSNTADRLITRREAEMEVIHNV